jgi:DNA polymerase V
MMRRITSIVRKTFPDQEIYSIDECFCDLQGYEYHDLKQLALDLRARILQFTGVPVCIGIGATKTLAKVIATWGWTRVVCFLNKSSYFVKFR